MDGRDGVEDPELAREVPDFAPRERQLQPPLPDGVFERLERLLRKIKLKRGILSYHFIGVLHFIQ